MTAVAAAPGRGTSNTNDRGSAAARRVRKAWLLATFGDGTTAPCYRCGAALDWLTLQVDRIIPGVLGGTYARDNIRPACRTCNIVTGNLVRDALRRGERRPTLRRLCRLGLL